jgi:hypothetical protein
VSLLFADGQSGTMRTSLEVASGTGHKNGYYNKTDDDHATYTIRCDFDIVSGSTYYLWYRVDAVGGSAGTVTRFPTSYRLAGNTTSSNLFSISASTVTIELSKTAIIELLGGSGNEGDGTKSFKLGLNSSADTGPDAFATPTGGDNNDGLIYDIIVPTVTNVDPASAKTGVDITVTGSSFDANIVANGDIDFGSTDDAIKSRTNSTTIVFETGSGDDNGVVKVTDSAGNQNTTGSTFVLDNTAPVVTSIATPDYGSSKVVKVGNRAVITGSGFTATGSQTVVSTLKIGATTIATANWTINDANTITVTGHDHNSAGNDIASDHILLTDAAGNSNADNDDVMLSIDITKPAITSVTNSPAGIAKNGGTVVLNGGAFNSTVGTSTVTIGGSSASTLFVIASQDADDVTLTIKTDETTANSNPPVLVYDAAGNVSTNEVYLDIDNSPPVVESVSARYVKNGTPSDITGSGFMDDGGTITDGTGSSAVTLTSSNLVDDKSGTFTTINTNSLRINPGAGAGGECTDCVVYVTDIVGNKSVATSVLLTIDNTLPVVNALTKSANSAGAANQGILKNGESIVIGGTGFGASAGAPTDDSINDDGVTINGAVPTGATWNTTSNTAITFTAGTGEVDNGAIVVTDAAENVCTSGCSAGTIYRITVDNTAPTGLSISAKNTNTDQTATTFKKDDEFYIASGNSDFYSSSFTAATAPPTVWIGGTNMTTYATVTVNSSSKITVTITTTSTANISGDLTVIDAAGNQSAAIKTIYIDNNVPTITSVTNPVIGNCAACTNTATVNTTTYGAGAPGFMTGNASAATGYTSKSTVAIAGDPAGFSIDADYADNYLKITAGGGEVEDVLITVTDPAGNPSVDGSSSVDHITIDNTAPTVASVSDSSIKNTATTTISGGGFYTSINGTDDGTGVKVYIGGAEIAGTTVSVGGDGTITYTAGTTEASGLLTVVDRAGNESTTNAKMRIDNTLPTVSAVTVGSIESGNKTVLSGSGFSTGGDAPTLTIGGSAPAGMTFVVDTDGQITITAGDGEVTDGKVVVTDQAGNASTDNVYLQIDNTAPTVSSISNSVIGACATCTQTTVLTGVGFTIGSYDVEASQVNLDGALPTGLTHTVSNSTSITITAGTQEVNAGTVTVVDSAGNETVTSSVKLTIDNSPPILTSVVSTKGNNILGGGHGRTAQAKSGDTFKIVAAAGGFNDHGGAASAVEIGGLDLATAVGAGGLGGSFTVDSDTEITVTAGAGEVTRGDIVVKDGVGNPSAETIFQGTIDNTVPDTPTIGLQDWNDYGYSNTDNWTSVNHADFDVSNVVSGDSITIYNEGVAVLSLMVAGGSAESGRSLWWDDDAEIQGMELAAGKDGITGGDGDYTFTAIVTDSAGNASTAGTMTYKLDMTDPAVPVLESFSSSASAVGVDESGTDKITNDNTPSIRVSNITVGNGFRLYYYLRGSADNDWEGVQFDLAGDTLTTAPFDAQIVGTEEKTWGDQTQGVIAALPDSADNVGDFVFHEYRIYGQQIDSAGNGSSSGSGIFYVDTKDPQTTLSYSTVNALTTLAEDPDSLMRFEDGQLTIKATFTDASGDPDGMNNTTPPTVSVDLPETTDDDFENAAMTVDPANDHIWTYTFTPPDGIDGSANVTVNGTDNAGNALVTASTVGSQLMVFDNTDPNPFTLAEVLPLGSYPKKGYFNVGTDSVSVLIPMDASDITLNGGQVKLKMQIVGGDATLTQVDTTVKISNYIDPLTIVTEKDSIRRNFSTSAGPPWVGETLGQGDRLFTIAERFDKAGNSRIGIASEDTLLIDTIPPVKGTWLIDMSGTTLTSTDTIIASVTGFSEALSAVDSYDWAVGKFKKTVNVLGDSVNVLTKLDSIGAWTTSDSTINGKAPLRDSTMHRLNVRALDEAGNISDTLYTDPGIWRLNSSPTIKTLGIVEVKEEDSLSFVVSDSVSDLDLATLLSDSLKYLFLQSDGTTTSHLFSVKPQNALLSTTPDTILTIDSTTGLITWAAPWHGDTTNYNVTLKIFSSEDADSTANKWDRSITENFILRVNENYVPRIAKMIYKNMAGQMDTLVTVPDTLKMWENDTITVTFSLSDLDDDTLISYGIIADSVQLALSTTDTAGSILPKDIQTTFTPDSAWDNMSKVTLSLSDGIVKDTLRTIKTKFILNVIHVPRPNFKMIMGQNPTFTRYYELMVTDTAEKAKNLSVYIYENLIEPQGEAKMDSMGNFTWVGNFEFDTTANYRIEMKGDGLQVGDTTIYDTVAHAIARAAGPWRAETYDGGFTVISKSANSVPFDKPFMIVDSLLFPLGEGEGGLYRMGHPLVEFEKSVMVTILADKRFPAEDQAIHQMFGGVWQELPTIHRKNEIMAWTNAMGYFKIGDKTIIVPEETLLGSNYPNPFNSSTNVEFDVGFFGGPNQRISVEVFNILGQKIKTLHKGPLAIGHHKLRWDARDMNESPVSSGVYVIRLLSDAGVSKSKKMTLLR